MARNSLGREIPAGLARQALRPLSRSLVPDADDGPGDAPARAAQSRTRASCCPSLRAAIEKAGLRDGMTIATHHHLRNGDRLLNLLVQELDAMGFRDIGLASSSVHPVHAEIIPAIRKGVVTRCETGVNGLIGELATKGELDFPIVVRSHGGRARSLVTDEVPRGRRLHRRALL